MRKTKSFVPASSLLLSLIGLLLASQLSAYGADANRDGRVDVRDVQRVVNLVLSVSQPSHAYHGDANNNGTTDASDVQMIVNMILQQPVPLQLAGPDLLPRTQAGHFYQVWLPAAGGTPPYAWSYSGQLPPGATFATDGTLTAVPMSGHYPFDVVLRDATGASVTRTVILSAFATNFPPTGNPDFYLMPATGPLVVQAPGLLVNDTDPESDPLTAVLEAPPSNGQLVLNSNGSFSYTLTAPMANNDSFTYRASDGLNLSAPVTVGIVTTAAATIAASDDDWMVEQGNQLFRPAPGVLANDPIPTGSSPTVSLASEALNGTVVLQQDGSFTYDPMPGYTGEDEFVYAVSALGQVVYATVRIWVYPTGGALDPFISSRIVSGPVQSGQAAEIQVRIRHPGNNLPTSHLVTAVSARVGSGALLPLSLLGHTSPSVAVYSGLLPTSGVGFGVHDVVVMATAGNVNLSDTTGLVVHLGSPIRVGPTRAVTTIQAALALVGHEGAILLDPGVYSGTSFTNLLLPRMVLASAEGRHRTVIQGGQGSVIAGLTGAGGAIIDGLTMEQTSSAVIELGMTGTVHRCRIRGGYATPTGFATQSAVRMTAPYSLIRDTVFRDLKLGDGTQSLLGGGAVYVNSGPNTMDRCGFYRCTVNSGGVAHGGAIWVDGAPSGYGNGLTVKRSVFGGNQAVTSGTGSSHRSLGGGVYVSGTASQKASIDIAGCRFVDCRAVALTSIAFGGAIFSLDSELRGTLVSILDCSVEAKDGGGGGIGVSSSTARIDQSEIRGCFISATVSGNGAGFYIQSHSAIWLTDVDVITCELPSSSSHASVGAGLYVLYFNSVSALRLRVKNCVAAYSPGLWTYSNNAIQLDQCTFENNHKHDVAGVSYGGGGAGIHLNRSSAFLAEHCQFIGDRPPSALAGSTGGQGIETYFNSGPVEGPGGNIMIQQPRPSSFRNCLFSGNGTSTGMGLALNLISGGSSGGGNTVNLVNCTFAECFSSNGSAIVNSGPTLSVVNTVVWDNTAPAITTQTGGTFTNCCIQGTLPFAASGTGNIFTNPQFVPGPLGGYYLAPSSPCIDAGTSALGVGAITTGLTTSPLQTPVSGNPDIGYHYIPTTALPQPRASMTIQQLITTSGVAVAVVPTPPALPFP